MRNGGSKHSTRSKAKTEKQVAAEAEAAKAAIKRGAPRPRVHVDKDLVRKLASFSLTRSEIANALKVSVETVRTHADDAVHEGWLHRNASLKRMQWERAELEAKGEGSGAMLIFLGKVYLKQSDGFLVKHTGVPHGDPNAAPIQVETTVVAEPLQRIMANPQDYAALIEMFKRAQLTDQSDTTQPATTGTKRVANLARQNGHAPGSGP